MKIPQDRSVFSNRRPLISNLAILLVGLIALGGVVLNNISRGVIQPIGLPTPTPIP